MGMASEAVLAEAEAFARTAHAHDTSGHDWWHVARVRALTRRLAAAEGADPFVCELAALLHDVADYKLAGDAETGLRTVRTWLEQHDVAADVREHVLEIIGTMSFSGGSRPPMRTLEGQVVQDADRLDALGAIGIARTFAFGGSRGRPLHDPERPTRTYATAAEYQQSDAGTINHFYEKLLRLTDLMNTATARELAQARHAYMEQFLEQFFAEWDGAR